MGSPTPAGAVSRLPFGRTEAPEGGVSVVTTVPWAQRLTWHMAGLP